MLITENRLRKLIKKIIKESIDEFLNHQDKINISLFDKHCVVFEENNKKTFTFIIKSGAGETTQINPEIKELLDFVNNKIEETIYKSPLGAYFNINKVRAGRTPLYMWFLECKYDPKSMEKNWNLPASMLECFLKPTLAELFMKACEALDNEYGIEIDDLPF